MHLSPSSRPTRARRLLAISAAAVAVMIGPTACDYGGYGNGSSANDMSDMGDMPGMDHGAGRPEQQPVVVPVANTAKTAPDAAAAAENERRAREGRNGRDGRDGRGRGGQNGQNGQGLGDRGRPLPPGGRDKPNNGLDILGRDCTASKLRLHNGFQSVDRKGADVGQGAGVAQCVNTEMGEVAAENQLPSLLITKFPTTVGVNQAFNLEVSTRNLVRDRFLGAAAGGYYLESSFLNSQGLQRGHFHTACRILDSTSAAPDSSKTPEFFLATEDKKGGAGADTVTVPIAKGIPRTGALQCTVWAGDGSHRTPMMTRANETPAIDSVRITVTDRAQPVAYDAAGAAAAAADQAGAKQQQAAGQQPDADPALDAASGPGAPKATAGADDAPAKADDAPAAADTATQAPAEDAPAGN